MPVALAAWKLHRPVRLAIDRNVDMAIIGKRHAFESTYHVAYRQDGEIVAMTTALASDGGNTIDCSFFVIHVAQLHADNCYLVPTFGVSGTVYKTNEASNISMRAFGVVQTILAQEDAIEQVGHQTGTSPEAIRRNMLYRSGDTTHYGEPLAQCTIRENWDRLLRDADFERRAEAVARFNAGNRWKKRGIAMIPLKYGAQYEVPALNYGGALVSVYAGDGSVVVQCGGVEVGQGLQTKVAQIAARALGICVDDVTVANPDTAVSVNATSTGADSGTDLNGWATYIAARQLRKRLERFATAPGQKPFPGANWQEKWPKIVAAAHGDRIDLAAHAFYKTKRVTDTQPYTYYSWSVGCSEVEVDVLTGQVTVLRADLLIDAGLPLNPLLDLGQAQGAYVQGLGFMFTEEILFDADGRLLTDGTWEYKPPCTHTIPVDFRVSLNVAERPLTTLGIEHTVALVSGAGPAAFRPDVAVLAQQAMLATAGDPPAVPEGSAAAADPAVVEQIKRIQVLDAAAIAADPELQSELDHATAAALHSAKTVGEPPVALAVSAFCAVKRAVPLGPRRRRRRRLVRARRPGDGGPGARGVRDAARAAAVVTTRSRRTRTSGRRSPAFRAPALVELPRELREAEHVPDRVVEVVVVPALPGLVQPVDARRRHRGATGPGGAGLPAPAERRGVPGTGRRVRRARHRRPPRADRRADAGPRRRARHHPAAARRPPRRRGDPERALRGAARRGSPAVPGDPGRVQRARRRVLARRRVRQLTTGARRGPPKPQTSRPPHRHVRVRHERLTRVVAGAR